MPPSHPGLGTAQDSCDWFKQIQTSQIINDTRMIRGAASPFSSADTLLWRPGYVKQLHRILAQHVWTKVFGSEPLHSFIVQKTSTPFFYQHSNDSYSLPAPWSRLLKTTNSPMKCKACCSIWIKCCILIHTVEVYANRFVQAKNILYMHAFEVQWSFE